MHYKIPTDKKGSS